MSIKTYNIITIGCQMNKSDGERIAGYLEGLGLKSVENKLKADLVVMMTCGVRQGAEDRIYGLIKAIKQKNKKAKVIVSGCLSEREDVRKKLDDRIDIWLPIRDLPNLGKMLGLDYKIEISNYLKVSPKYNSCYSAFVPIGNGCNNFCAYCVVPYARGREVYRDADEILNEVKDLVKNGYKEIILIAQNVNSYKSYDLDFPDLLKKVNDIKSDFWIRFATSHPKDMSDKLIQTITKGDKICEHIHLPVQAGDDEILKAMNRKYTSKHYLKLIKKIRQLIPDVSLTTDTIVGFPGETKRQFNNTVKLYKKAKFDMAYIAEYSPRPGTAAFKLKDDVAKEEKRRRNNELMDVLRKTAWENNKQYEGRVVDVLIDGVAKDGVPIGKTRTGKVVRILAGSKQKTENRKQEEGMRKKKGIMTGEFAKVKINKARDFGLDGELVIKL